MNGKDGRQLQGSLSWEGAGVVQIQESGILPESAVLFFHAAGFLLLRHCFDPIPLGEELDRAMREGLLPQEEAPGEGGIHFRYLPMMTAATPRSLKLLDDLEPIANALLGGPVLPTRAKGVQYRGNTPWHRDSELSIRSIGFAAYLEPLGEHTGALRVLPGSHQQGSAESLPAFGVEGLDAQRPPGVVIPSEPGDVIVFDERLFHASSGGEMRRQWRVDYLADPVGRRAEEAAQAYFKNIFPGDWDGGYDVDRFPSYGADWLRSSRASIKRLEALGVYEFASAQETFARSRRRSRSLKGE